MLRSRITLHFIFWLAFWLFKVYHEFIWLVAKYSDQTDWQANLFMAVKAQLVLLPARMLFTYWILWVILKRPKALSHSIYPWLKLVFGIMVGVVFMRFLTVYIALPFAYDELPETQAFLTIPKFLSNILDLAVIGGLAASISLYRRHMKTREREQLLQKEKIASELKFLRQQTNPHFLFNTLNNLYGLARRESPQTAQALLQLSKLMRYMLYEASTNFVFLQKEVEIIRDYIGLERLRHGDRLKVNFQIQGEIKDKQIAPLLLLPLVENAFKHGAGESDDSPFILIDLKCKADQLFFEVENNVALPLKKLEEGIGMSNLRRQLALIYPAHELIILPGLTTFKVKLIINLKNHEAVKLFDYRRRTHSGRNSDRLYSTDSLSRS